MRHLLLVILLTGGLCATALGSDVWLQGDRISLELSGDLNWMPSWATYKGQSYQNGLVANASVLELSDDGFVGGVHKHETLLQANLEVDGAPVDLVGPILEGKHFHFSRALSLDGAYQVAHDLTLSGSEITERFDFTGLDPTRNVVVFYPVMASRVNSFTQWMTFDAAGAVLSEGQATADDGSFTMFPQATRAVAVFDPIAGIGTVMRWDADAALDPRSFLWDRGTPPDNKVYLRLFGAEGAANRQFEVSQRMTLFESTSGDWRYAALAWAAPTPGDVNGDGSVDLNDFGLLKANFGGVGLSVPGDLNRNGEVDLSDFGVLKESFARAPWPPAASEPVPEPAAWLLAGFGALTLTALCRLRLQRV
ncbi:MAG: hypothetical protein U0836_18470 [Pirellulales bacterium]